MFMGDDSSLKGCGFESRHHILDGNFFALICCTSYIVCSKKTENKLKEAWVGPFLKHPILLHQIPSYLEMHFWALIMKEGGR